MDEHCNINVEESVHPVRTVALKNIVIIISEMIRERATAAATKGIACLVDGTNSPRSQNRWSQFVHKRSARMFDKRQLHKKSKIPFSMSCTELQKLPCLSCRPLESSNIMIRLQL